MLTSIISMLKQFHSNYSTHVKIMKEGAFLPDSTVSDKHVSVFTLPVHSGTT